MYCCSGTIQAELLTQYHIFQIRQQLEGLYFHYLLLFERAPYRHPDAFQATNLQRELESKGIKRLIVTGVQTEYCVDTTCRRAYSLGYDVTLVKDAHSTWDTDHLSAPQIIAHHNHVLGGWFAELKEANEIDLDYVSSRVS